MLYKSDTLQSLRVLGHRQIWRDQPPERVTLTLPYKMLHCGQGVYHQVGVPYRSSFHGSPFMW